MKKQLLTILSVVVVMVTIGTLMSFKADEQEKAESGTQFTYFTVVESIVPNGIGRSRIIDVTDEKNYKDYTKVMTEEDKGRNKSNRGEIRAYGYEETKLLNFYNLGGIRFQNIAANDAIVESKVNAMLADGWKIVAINSGIESDAGKQDGVGIYITRYYFQK